MKKRTRNYELLSVISNSGSMQVTIASRNAKKLNIRPGTLVKQWVFDPGRDTMKKGDIVTRIVELKED